MPHDRLDVLHLHEVKLHVLAGRDVPAARRPALRHVGERDELLGREHALRDLAADHHRPVLTLAVDAVHEAERTPDVRRDVATLERFEFIDESVELAFVGEPEPRRAERLWVVHLGHDELPTRRERSGAPAEWR